MAGRSSLFLIILAALTVSASAQTTLTQADLLRRMIDLDRLMTPPAKGERTLLFSSWDRTQRDVRDGRLIHWDANSDTNQFLRVDQGWSVMAECEGAGVVNRIWVDKPVGQLRLTIDDQAVLTAKMNDVFEGAVEPFGAPFCEVIRNGEGATCRFPIGFSNGLRIECQEFTGAYQIDVTQPPTGVAVVPFQPKLDAEDEKALREVGEILKQGFTEKQLLSGRRISSQGGQQSVAPRAALTWDIDKPGVIRALYVATTDRFEPREAYALHNVIIRLTTDGASKPDIEAPLAEFFGVGFERQRYNSLVLGTDRWTDMPGEFPPESWFMYCFFPIPFSAKARIEIENRTSKKLGLMLLTKVDRDAPPVNALRFRARYHTEDPCKTFDYPILDESGPGRLVGCSLHIDCPRAEWWGSGDHKMWVDGESFPSILGTATSHYFGNLDAELLVASGPFQGVTRAASFGKNSLYRWHIADSVPFAKSLKFTIENWQIKQQDDVYYSSTAYWYADAKAPIRDKPLTLKELRTPGLRIPGAVEIEGHVRGSDWGVVLEQRHSGGVEYSGERAVRITTTQPVAIEVPAPAKGKYRIGLRANPQRSFGSIDVRGDAGMIGKVEYRRAAEGMYEIGVVELKEGSNNITIVCDRSTILDCWTLEPVP